MTAKHSDWLLDAVPGARELADKIDATTADFDERRAALSSAHTAALRAYRESIGVSRLPFMYDPQTGNKVPAPGVSHAELDTDTAMIASHAAESRALRAPVELATMQVELAALLPEPASEALRDLAVSVALKAHADASDLWPRRKQLSRPVRAHTPPPVVPA
ncbi:hypothetical protein J7E29_02435 [Streptomyces sp. ISL-90]|nr:hypothetical protein [Streptomyces sp. ISL-90]